MSLAVRLRLTESGLKSPTEKVRGVDLAVTTPRVAVTCETSIFRHQEDFNNIVTS